jgi:hypothetical protein
MILSSFVTRRKVIKIKITAYSIENDAIIDGFGFESKSVKSSERFAELVVNNCIFALVCLCSD